MRARGLTNAEAPAAPDGFAGRFSSGTTAAAIGKTAVASAYSQANRGRAVAAVLQATDKGTAIITSLIDGATDPRRYAHEGLLLLRARFLSRRSGGTGVADPRQPC